MNIKRLFEPAFSVKNRRISFLLLKVGLIFTVFFGVSLPSEDVMIWIERPKVQAIADAKLRDVAWKRMREACFTDREIKDYWYEQMFMKTPRKALVLSRAREALCGGRGLCGCKIKEKTKGSV